MVKIIKYKKIDYDELKKNDPVWQEALNKALFESNRKYKDDGRFLTRIGREKQLQTIRKIGNNKALQYNRLIEEKLSELGLPYIPFLLEYIETEKKQKTTSGKMIKIPKHNFTLHIDDMFVRKVNSRKISYHTWMTRKNPELGSRYYREVIRGLAKNEKYTATPQWSIGGSLWKQYQKEVPAIEQEIPQMDYDLLGKTEKGKLRGKLIITHMSTQHHALDSNNYGKGKGRYKMPFQHRNPYKAGDTVKVSTLEIDKFIENEQYMFSGNLHKFLIMQTPEDREVINEILTDVLGQFKNDMEQLGRGVWADEYKYLMGGTEKAPKYQIGQKTKKWSKTKPKFPNIESILWWFINNKKGLQSSTKLQKYNNLKTLKQKRNFIDRAVFLIANGIYAKKLGHKKGLTSTGRQKIYGKAATIKHAQKYKRFSNERTKKGKRVEKMYDWRKITSTTARGLSKRKDYRNSRKDNRKDNR